MPIAAQLVHNTLFSDLSSYISS